MSSVMENKEDFRIGRNESLCNVELACSLVSL